MIKKECFLFLVLFILIVLLNLSDEIKVGLENKNIKEKSDIKLLIEFLEERIPVAYLHLYCDLPKFYFVPLEDLTLYQKDKIRIWDENDLILGKCEDELEKRLKDKNLEKYWNGPYIQIPPFPEQKIMVGNYEVKDVIIDIWGRKYRMFYYTYKDKDNPTETERKIIGNDEGVFILISGGPDGILQSCASDKTSVDSVIKTSPFVEKAKSSDFENFDPFCSTIVEPDPYIILSERNLKKMKEKATKQYEEFLRKEGRI
ncbi:MAG: hypothetical protein NC833_05370 [Candidatus Omnitrophica bacterium]|nr:hypothetical protein [Candidatus Omnitrophota bacterium]